MTSPGWRSWSLLWAIFTTKASSSAVRTGSASLLSLELLGVVIGLAGIFRYSGAIWARTLGVVVAVARAVANFAALPSYPTWLTIVIALDVFIIWALTVHGRDITR